MTTDTELLARIAAALERLAPPVTARLDFDAADAFVWHAGSDAGAGRFEPVAAVNRVPLSLLQGIDRAARQLLDNTERFARGLPANNALLWGARGMGKSSLVKAAHAEVAGGVPPPLRGSCPEGAEGARGSDRPLGSPPPLTPPRKGEGNVSARLKLIEIHREDIDSLPACLGHLKASPHRFIVFCDDLSFDHDDTSYKSLKAVLEGGIEGRPDNVLFYATSNRRHLMPRDMIENERSSAINPAEAVEEKVSLSDRFGLWLGFHNCSQDDYLAMVRAYVGYHGLKVEEAAWTPEALEWSMTRGARSGRVAWQFVQDLAGRLGQRLRVG